MTPEAPTGTDPPAPPRALMHNAAWSLMGEVGYAAGLFGTLIVLAKLGSVEALGQYTLGLAIATPAILLTNLHLRPAYVVDEGRWPYADYLGLRLLTIPGALIVTGLIAWAAGYGLVTATMVLAVGGLRALESVSDILLAPAQKAERMASIGVSRALRGLLTAGGIGLGLALTGDARVGMACALVGLGGLSLLYDLRVARRFGSTRPSGPRRSLLRLARYALPMGLAATLLTTSAQVPAFVLEQTHDLATLGYFGAVSSIMYVGQVLNVALGNAAIPRLARRHQQGRRALHGMLRWLLLVVIGVNGVLLLGTVLLGSLYLRLAYGASYVAYTPELILAAGVAGVAGLANMLSQTLTAMGRFTQQLKINVVGLTGSLIATLWLVPEGGLRGAIWAVLVLSTVRLAIYAGVLLRPAR